MPDDPADNLRKFNLLVVPAVLVPQGGDPRPLLRNMITDPVEIPCRIERIAPPARAGTPPAAAGPQSDSSPSPDGRPPAGSTPGSMAPRCNRRSPTRAT